MEPAGKSALFFCLDLARACPRDVDASVSSHAFHEGKKIADDPVAVGGDQAVRSILIFLEDAVRDQLGRHPSERGGDGASDPP